MLEVTDVMRDFSKKYLILYFKKFILPSFIGGGGGRFSPFSGSKSVPPSFKKGRGGGGGARGARGGGGGNGGGDGGGGRGRKSSEVT